MCSLAQAHAKAFHAKAFLAAVMVSLAEDLEGQIGPIDPPGGVDWEAWTSEQKDRLREESGCRVIYRQRNQWGPTKKVVVYGPSLKMRDALQKAISQLPKVEKFEPISKGRGRRAKGSGDSRGKGRGANS